MAGTKRQHDFSAAPADGEAVEHLKQAVAGGKPWFIALLEAVALWTEPEEERGGRLYRYLIAGEAFDWLLLAQRLIEEIDSLIPEAEREALLFHNLPAVEMSREQFKSYIGNAKYRAYLNYFYGVTVEEFLHLAIIQEIRKEKRALGINEDEVHDEAYLRLYGATESVLLEEFRQEKKYPSRKSVKLAQLKEFTYWLFKRRLKLWDKARVASDTKRGLEELRRQQAISRLDRGFTSSSPA